MHELPPLPEHEPTPREHLLELERSGEYVFHGSPAADIPVLEPRQPHTLVDGRLVPDGEPAVACTQFADIAIFRALTARRLPHISTRSTFGLEQGVPHFAISKVLWQAVHEEPQPGFVYVFTREGFTLFRSFEYRSPDAVIPTEVVQVSPADLQFAIEVKEDSWAELK